MERNVHFLLVTNMLVTRVLTSKGRRECESYMLRFLAR